MPALTYKGKFINLSYVDDTLTFYPTFPFYEGDKNHLLRNCLEVIEECGKLDFVIKRLHDRQSTTQNEEFITALESIRSKSSLVLGPKTDYDKIVRRNDEDHLRYHRENKEDKSTFRCDASHWHIKFTSILNLEQLGIILDIFIKKDLFSRIENLDFLTKVSERYKTNQQMLDSLLCQNQHKDAETIRLFIHHCHDNDVLADLHLYLASPKYDYLRMIDVQKERQENQAIYQSMNYDRQIVQTSKAWAMLEKAISLRMSENIRTQCTKFTPNLGKKCAEQLNNQYGFFGIKRKSKHDKDVKNNVYDAMTKGYDEKLSETYKKIFK